MKFHLSRRFGTFIVLALLPTSIITTVTAADATPPAGPPSATQSILIEASKQLAATPTIRFELKVEGDTFIDDGKSLRLLEASGELVRPESVRTDFKLKVMGTVTISTSMVIIGEQRWSTDLITGSWGDAPEEFGYDPGILFDNQNGIGPVMDRIQDPTQLADEKVHDRDAHHITAQVKPEILDDLTSGTMSGDPISVDLWIDKETHDVLRVRLTEPDTVTDREPAVWTLDITDQGKEFTIEPPA